MSGNPETSSMAETDPARSIALLPAPPPGRERAAGKAALA